MDASETPPQAPEVKPRRRRRWGRGFLLLLFVVGVLTGGAGAALVKTARGQHLVVEAALNRVRGALAGSLEVDSVRSPNLLGGVTLVGLRLQAAEGRDFLQVDSARVRYSPLGLLWGTTRISSLSLWGPRVVISRYPGEEASNLSGLRAPRDSVEKAPVPAAGPRPIRLGTVRVVGGLVEVLTPVEGAGPRIPTVPAPEGDGRLRRLALQGLNGELRGVTLTLGAPELLAGDLTQLALDVGIFDEALRITRGEGRLTFGADGLTLTEAAVRLPTSPLTGSFAIGPRADAEGTELRLDVTTDGPAALADLAWLDPRVPEGQIRGRVVVTVADGITADLDGLRGELEASRFSADGRVELDEGLVLRNLELQASPLSLARLEPWLAGPLPLDGWLSGGVTLSGRIDALEADGRLTLVPIGFGGRPTTADFRGTVYSGADPGVSDFEALLDPLSFDVLEAMIPRFRVKGTGRAHVQATGRMNGGFRFISDVEHDGDSIMDARIVAGGSLRRREDGSWVTDMQADLARLRLGLLSATVPGMDEEGVVAGTVRIVGSLRELDVDASLAVGEGGLTLNGTVDVASPGNAYDLSLAADDVLLSDLFSQLPAPTRWTGELTAVGRGLERDSLAGNARVKAAGSRVGGLHVDSLDAAVTVRDGVLGIDTVRADVGGFQIEGGGSLGISSVRDYEARLDFRTESLLGLRPIFMGDTVIARDELSEFERTLLRFEGVEPDTLPLLADVEMGGALSGRLTLRGGLDRLDLQAEATLADGAYGRDRVGDAEVSVEIRDVLRPEREMDLSVTARGVSVFDRSLDELEAEITSRGPDYGVRIDASRSGSERYTLAGDVALDSLGGEVRLAEAAFQIDSVEWRVARPVRVTWDSARVTVLDLEVVRGGPEPMRVVADGYVDRAGQSNFRIDGTGLGIGRALRLAQLEELEASGQTDFSMTLQGPAEAPVIDALVQVDQPRWGELDLARISAALSYRDQVATVRLEAVDSTRLVLEASGTVPVNLALTPQERRTVAEPMNVTVKADSLDAHLALSPLGLLENVAGVVSGDFTIGGTLDAIEPSGVLRLGGAAWTIESLGVRHTDVRGTLTLNPDRVVDVSLSSHAGGVAQVSGSFTLDPLFDPTLDLTVDFFGFQAVNRRDVEGRISGALHLGGRYRQPLVEGNLSVDRGTLFLEEFVRSATVVDLTDPRIFEVVDTTALTGRALLAGVQNPFLQNLRMNVDLAVPRDTWLRSPDMNVEMGGQLIVSYDRVDRDLVMVGELQALRGSYSLLGRSFEVQGGTVGFIGTPGINPTLAIEAVATIRRVEQDPLEVSATVEGTLITPRVALSSTEQGVAESDLVSYLVFGRPSHELATGQQAIFGGAGGSLAGAATGFGVTYLSGTLASRIGTAVAQQIGIDYLSISQAGDFGVLGGTALAGTQVEVGQYLTNDVFFVLIFRPLSGQSQGTTSFFGGARMEVALNYDVSLQGFWEDRFLRSRIGGFGDLGLQAAQVQGIFLFRDWGY